MNWTIPVCPCSQCIKSIEILPGHVFNIDITESFPLSSEFTTSYCFRNPALARQRKYVDKTLKVGEAYYGGEIFQQWTLNRLAKGKKKVREG